MKIISIRDGAIRDGVATRIQYEMAEVVDLKPLQDEITKLQAEVEKLKKAKPNNEPQNPSKTKSTPTDPYASLTVGQMRSQFTKAENIKKATELGVEFSKSWTEKKICEAIFANLNP